VAVIAIGFSGAALAQTRAAEGSPVCQADYDKYCKGTTPAGGHVTCLSKASAACRQALAALLNGSTGRRVGRTPAPPADNREALLTQLSRINGVTEVRVSSGVLDPAASKLRRHHGKTSKKFAHSKKVS